jgi:hypothetical protein
MLRHVTKKDCIISARRASALYKSLSRNTALADKLPAPDASFRQSYRSSYLLRYFSVELFGTPATGVVGWHLDVFDRGVVGGRMGGEIVEVGREGGLLKGIWTRHVE